MWLPILFIASFFPTDTCRDLVIPNAITPNGCVGCENFRIRTTCEFSLFEMKLFDRWGNKKFESTDPAFELDITERTEKGELVFQGDVYVYILKAQLQGASEPVMYNGTFTVI